MNHYSIALPSSPLCIQGLRVALAGPGSIETVKWTARSRATQFGFVGVPTPLAVLVMTIVGLPTPMLQSLTHKQLYSLVLPHGNFDGFVRGEGALYRNFFDARVAEIQQLSASKRATLFQFQNRQVFGSDLEDDRDEIERQAVYNREKQRELATLAQKNDEGENESQEKAEEGEEEGEGN